MTGKTSFATVGGEKLACGTNDASTSESLLKVPDTVEARNRDRANASGRSGNLGPSGIDSAPVSGGDSLPEGSRLKIVDARKQARKQGQHIQNNNQHSSSSVDPSASSSSVLKRGGEAVRRTMQDVASSSAKLFLLEESISKTVLDRRSKFIGIISVLVPLRYKVAQYGLMTKRELDLQETVRAHPLSTMTPSIPAEDPDGVTSFTTECARTNFSEENSEKDKEESSGLKTATAMIGVIAAMVAAALEETSTVKEFHLRVGTDRGELSALFFVTAWVSHYQEILHASGSTFILVIHPVWCRFHALATGYNEGCIRVASAYGWSAHQLNEYARLFVCAVRNRLYLFSL